MPGEREDLSNAVAHEAGPDYRDARLRHQLSRGVAAIGIKDVAKVEIRRSGRQKQEWPREIFGLAEAALWHACEKALAHVLCALSVLIHPRRERRTEYGWPQSVYGDAGFAPLAAKRFG